MNWKYFLALKNIKMELINAKGNAGVNSINYRLNQNQNNERKHYTLIDKKISGDNINPLI